MASLRFQKIFPPEQVKKIKILNAVGRIRIASGNAENVQIDVTVTVPGAEMPARSAPVVRLENGILWIRSSGPHFREEQEGQDETLFSDDVEAAVEPGYKNEISVYVPSGIHLDVRCRQGVIDCRDISGTFRLKTLNGPISLHHCDGACTAKTTNGPISIRDGRFTELKLKTINGPLRIYPSSIQGDIQIKTVNGPIRFACPAQSDIALLVRSGFAPIRVSSGFPSELRSMHAFQGTLNRGLYPVRIKSVAGPVSVLLSDRNTHRDTQTSSIKKSLSSLEEDPLDIIERMVRSGTISPEEASRLKAAL